MLARKSSNFTKGRCKVCLDAGRHGNRACPLCSSLSKPRKHFPKPLNMRSTHRLRYVDASVLRNIVKHYKDDPCMMNKALKRSAYHDDVKPEKQDHGGVILAMGDFERKTPAITLTSAEGEVPSIDYKSWTVLGRKTWEGLVSICVEEDRRRPYHKRDEYCGGCVKARDMSDMARLMFEERLDWEEEEMEGQNQQSPQVFMIGQPSYLGGSRRTFRDIGGHVRGFGRRRRTSLD